MVTTRDESYRSWTRPRIKFKSLDGTDTYFEFNPFSSPKDVNVIYMDVEDAMGETGTFNIIVEDSNNIIDKDHLRNTKVYLELGKSEASLSHFLIGFADIFDSSRPRTNYQEYRISGFGSVIRAAELLLLIRQASKIDNLSSQVKPDANFSVKAQYERSFSERKFRPLNREDFEELSGWTADIADDLTINYPIINEVFTTYWDYWDRLASLQGNEWFVNYSGGQEVLTAKHPSFLHSGITIKSGDLQSVSDDATKTSYIKSSFSVTDDASTNAGVRTRLYTTTVTDRETVSSSFVDKGSTTLNQRFIAQQFKVANDQRRITDLAFILHKIGEPTSPKDRVNGEIRLDNGGTPGKPTGDKLASFEIPLSSIESQSDTIFINDINFKSGSVQGITKLWIVLKDRSGLKGNVENDPANTVGWHHDGVFAAKVDGEYSASFNVTDSNDRDNIAGLNWVVSTSGPKYTYSAFANIRRLQARTNPSAASRIRMKEAFIDSSFLKDSKSVNRFLSLNLSKFAKARRSVTGVRVTIPNNTLFRPYQFVTFADGLSDIVHDLQVSRARYVISALPGDPQYGTTECELTLNGQFNTLLGSCSCE